MRKSKGLFILSKMMIGQAENRISGIVFVFAKPFFFSFAQFFSSSKNFH